MSKSAPIASTNKNHRRHPNPLATELTRSGRVKLITILLVFYFGIANLGSLGPGTSHCVPLLGIRPRQARLIKFHHTALFLHS